MTATELIEAVQPFYGMSQSQLDELREYLLAQVEPGRRERVMRDLGITSRPEPSPGPDGAV